MKKAKRLRFPAVRQTEWEEFEIPQQPEPYQLVVETHCSLVSAGTELAIYTGQHTNFTAENPTFEPIPNNPGYALVGHITALGDLVHTIYPALELNQRVLLQAPHGSAAVVDVRTTPSVIQLPDAVTDAQGTLLRLGAIAITAPRVAPLQIGESVVVFGLGLVGQMVAQLYHLNGAHPVIGVDRIQTRLDVAEEYGITTLNATEDLAAEIAARTNGHGADVVIEATGSPAVVPIALEAAAAGGRAVLLGSTRGPVETLDVYSLIHHKRLRLIGAHEMAHTFDYATGIRWPQAENSRLLASLFAAGKLRGDALISHTIRPDDALTIHDALADRPQEYLGVLIDWRQ